MGLTFQVNVWLLAAVPLLAATVIVYGPAAASPAARIPEIRPVVLLMLRPVGRPPPLYVSVPLAVVAAIWRDTASPSVAV